MQKFLLQKQMNFYPDILEQQTGTNLSEGLVNNWV
jgi:hypothetical protein